ncbi:apolipoprotein N-acyltransferase [Paracoccus sp. TK19116]|uniref:Apolipoprotein N-acyltransferase n=2 Tax=Paracoccus albicereus TaxID=2922394 RepID=A0ABT1MTC9_9RHOB|nr:apolipoprotein N-acyltransferase [Paracoccus albicereus]
MDAALGALAATGQAPLSLWAATLIALAILLWRFSRAASLRGIFASGLAAGVGWFALSLSWIVEPFLVEPEIYGWMAPFALILMALGGGLFWAMPVACGWRIAAGWRWRIVAIAAALVLSDWLRGWIFTGFPWASIGHVWIGTPIAQAAAWIGAPGLSALSLAAAALPVILWRPSERTVYGFAPGAGLSVLILGAIWAGGLSRLDRPLPPDTGVRLRLVQPNAEQRLKWDPQWAAEFYRRLLDLSSEPGARDLVIWPESAVNFLLDDAGPVLSQMSGAAGAPLILGIQRREEARFFNSLAVLTADGAVGPIYDKFHLVPFGEYIPWGDALARFGIRAFAAQEGFGYSSGPGPMVLDLPGLPPLQPLICYEAIFPQHLRAIETRPGWLLQITNDAWFGQFSGPYQHLAQARLRAVQSGLPLVRVANTGVSAVIDARGNVRATLGLDQQGKIDAVLPAALPATFWMRWGDWPVVGLMALLLAGAGIARSRKRKT